MQLSPEVSLCFIKFRLFSFIPIRSFFQQVQPGARPTLESPPCSHPVPLFRYTWMGASNVPLTQHQFTEKLKTCLTKMGLDASQYSGHSFRRGGAQFALQCGLSTELIKLQGDWKSNACERYLEPSFELRKQVSETMGASVGAVLSS